MFIRRKEPSRLLSTIKTNFLSEIHSIRETQGNAERISVWVLLVKEAEAKSYLEIHKGLSKGRWITQILCGSKWNKMVKKEPWLLESESHSDSRKRGVFETARSHVAEEACEGREGLKTVSRCHYVRGAENPSTSCQQK